ncbi:hypothetical protein Q4508_05970 [Amphritea sp. 2_MG-2023]|uniref:hypothetical protein n=1 Tax=Amphritea TaxID=515417 RepID=UPI001C07E9C3|nr:MULTISPECIES: hypothetical protein [Amphritea]MBU2966012.1 hypothetical protein [Amphritea atlantica]MDO6418102.1 hypothetical protein [Amphritea sp. 2_MG-2023]
MKYAFVFCLALLTGCSTLFNQPEYNLTYNLSDEIIHPLSCNQYNVCSALYIDHDRPRTLKLAVSGEYHSINSATLWIDNQAFPLTPTIAYTRNGQTHSGNRIAMRPFTSEQPIKEKLQQANKVFLEIRQQSTSFKTLMKDEGFLHTEWKELLAGLN